jgi:alginate O-acetyltransferase complex protein AlgI
LEKFCDRRGWTLPAPAAIKQLLLFVIVMNSWVLFRADSLGYATRLWGRMYGVLPQLKPTTEPFALIFPPHGLAVIAVGLLIALIPLPEALRRLAMIKDSPKLDTIRWATSIILFFAALSSVMASGSPSFLYFRF